MNAPLKVIGLTADHVRMRSCMFRTGSRVGLSILDGLEAAHHVSASHGEIQEEREHKQQAIEDRESDAADPADPTCLDLALSASRQLARFVPLEF